MTGHSRMTRQLILLIAVPFLVATCKSATQDRVIPGGGVGATGESIIGTKKDPAKSRGYSKAVAGIQLDLKRLGYDPGPIDGLLGPKTKAAIAKFEGAQGLPPGWRIGERAEDAEQIAPPAQENRSN